MQYRRCIVSNVVRNSYRAKAVLPVFSLNQRPCNVVTGYCQGIRISIANITCRRQSNTRRISSKAVDAMKKKKKKEINKKYAQTEIFDESRCSFDAFHRIINNPCPLKRWKTRFSCVTITITIYRRSVHLGIYYIFVFTFRPSILCEQNFCVFAIRDATRHSRLKTKHVSSSPTLDRD